MRQNEPDQPDPNFWPWGPTQLDLTQNWVKIGFHSSSIITLLNWIRIWTQPNQTRNFCQSGRIWLYYINSSNYWNVNTWTREYIVWILEKRNKKSPDLVTFEHFSLLVRLNDSKNNKINEAKYMLDIVLIFNFYKLWTS